MKDDLKTGDSDEMILRSIQESTCLEIAGQKRNSGAIVPASIGSGKPQPNRGSLFIYIIAFIPIVLSNFRGTSISRRLYFTKTNIRQEA